MTDINMANTVPTQPSSSTSPPPTAMRDIQMLICVICSKCTPTGQDDSVANVAAEIAQEVWLMDCSECTIHICSHRLTIPIVAHTICEYCKDGVRRAKTPSEIPRCKRCRKRVKVDKLLRIFPYETIPPPSHEFRNNQHKLALERYVSWLYMSS
jgi:hypothetical protein